MKETDRKDDIYADSLDGSGILLVDDNPYCLKTLELLLKMAGYKISCAANGKEALSLLRIEQFMLMITDYNMPEMNGFALSKEAKKITPELNIIMVTGDCLPKVICDDFKPWISVVLPKPVDIKRLLAEVRA